MYVLDSSAIIEILRGGVKKDALGRILGDESLCTTSISMFEIMNCIRSQRNQLGVEGLLGRMKIFDLDTDAAKEGSRIYKELMAKGKPVNCMDVLIAGIAKVNGGTVLTCDTDFLRVGDAKVV